MLLSRDERATDVSPQDSQDKRLPLEDVGCNLCGTTQISVFARRRSGQLVRCRACSLVYVSPRPGSETLDVHYNTDMSSRISYYLLSAEADRRTFIEILALVERHAAKGRILDVGCNIGTFLELCRQRAWEEVYGVEINRQAVTYCRQRGLAHVLPLSLQDAPFAPEFFDAVTLNDVIEHVPDPLQTLRLAYRFLVPGGVIAVCTPNISSVAGQLFQIKPLEHLYYFSPHTLERVLTTAGFRILELRRYDRFRNVSALTHSTTFEDFPLLKHLFGAIRRWCGDVIVRFPFGENLLALAQKPR